MAITMPPPTPPPATLERIDDKSIPLADAPAAAAPPPVNMPKSCPPSPPPTMPAMELPIGPKLNFCISAPAILPPTPPLIKLMIKGNQVLLFIESSAELDFAEGPPIRLKPTRCYKVRSAASPPEQE